jgi:hypothetical protein
MIRLVIAARRLHHLLAGAAAAIACAAGLACGSGQPHVKRSAPTSVAEATTASVPSEAPAQTQPTPTAPSPESVGRVTATAAGTRINADLQLGELKYGSTAESPPGIAEACGVADVEGSAFARGDLRLTYAVGTVPLTLHVNNGQAVVDIVADSQDLALLAFNEGGTWNCGEAGYSLSLQPQASATYETWLVITRARSNAEPTLSREFLNDLSVQLEFVSPEITGETHYTVSGPRAASCGQRRHYLLPFAHVPFLTSDGTRCVLGGGTFERGGV